MALHTHTGLNDSGWLDLIIDWSCDYNYQTMYCNNKGVLCPTHPQQVQKHKYYITGNDGFAKYF